MVLTKLMDGTVISVHRYTNYPAWYVVQYTNIWNKAFSHNETYFTLCTNFLVQQTSFVRNFTLSSKEYALLLYPGARSITKV